MIIHIQLIDIQPTLETQTLFNPTLSTARMTVKVSPITGRVEATLTALRPVAAGDEIWHSYVDRHLPKASRAVVIFICVYRYIQRCYLFRFRYRRVY